MPARLSEAERHQLHAAVAAVADPEVPVLTIEDLGVLRSIEEIDGRIVVTITPTYSGCPAMGFIADEVARVLETVGLEGEVRTVLSPPWTTAWMSPAGRAKLEAFGIAPPSGERAFDGGGGVAVHIDAPLRCPHCHSRRTRLLSQFGSTACKALHQCLDCLEPFDYFKELR